eukprot:TRINITY_DN21307_c0_g1_i1.p1 TRINITY_DN21307_c0_g1~~TRINITY_DN21307_c0_g1_i1.p1  ORF type:complete len:1076 (+),score=167.63 TRINITY_DN21307_c0_g1_i1:57-3230(+)
MALLQRSVFRWLHLVDARRGVLKQEKPHSQITAEEVSQKYGVPDDVLLSHIEAEVLEAETFQTLPYTLMMMVAFTVAVVLHDPVVPVNAVEDSIAFDIKENANFAFAGNWMGHKSIEDVNSHADFWSWMIRGFLPLIFQQSTTWSEDLPLDDPVVAAANENFPREQRGMVLNYNRLVGGVRLRSERSGEACQTMPSLLRFYDQSCVGGQGYELYPELYPGFGAHITYPVESGPGEAFWLYSHDDYSELLDTLWTKETTERWLDKSTRKIEIALPMYNSQLGIHSLITVNFYFSRGGHIWKKIIGMSTFSRFYYSWFDFAPDIIWLTTLTSMLVHEIRHIVHHFSSGGVRGVWTKYLTWWSFMDWSSVIVGFVLIVLFILRQQGSGHLNVILQTLLNIDEDSRRADYRAKASEYIELLEMEVHQLYTFRVMVGVYPLLMMFRLFKAFAAQPRLSIVTRTLGNAAVDLVHFLLVFLSIFCTYAVAGVILFGREVDDFTTFPRALVTSFLVMMGDFDWEELSRVGRLEGFMWFGTFTVIIVLLMLNMLLAIVMDSYADVKEELGDAETLLNELKQMFSRWRGQRKGTVVPLKEVLKAVSNNRDNLEVFSETMSQGDVSLERVHMSKYRSSRSTVSEEPELVSYSIVSMSALREICPRMSEEQALEIIQVAVEKFYSANKEKADVEELLLAMRKVDYSTKKMKKEVKRSIASEAAAASPGDLNAIVDVDELQTHAATSFLDEINACRVELKQAKDWMGDAPEEDEEGTSVNVENVAESEAPASGPEITAWSVRYVLEDHDALLAACREAGINAKNDVLRLQCAGMAVKIIEVDASDGTVKCRAPGVGDVWFGLGAITSQRKRRPSVSSAQETVVEQAEETSPNGVGHEEFLRRKQELEADLQAGRQTVSEALAAVSELEWALLREQEEKEKLAQKFLVLKKKVAQLNHENVRLVDEVKKQDEKHERVGTSREEYYELARQMMDENQRLKDLLRATPQKRQATDKAVLALTDAPNARRAGTAAVVDRRMESSAAQSYQALAARVDDLVRGLGNGTDATATRQ